MLRAKTQFLTSAALAATLALPVSSFAATEIMVNGSTTVLPIMQKVAEDYMAVNPSVSIAISGGGSGNGIKALVDGLATIAMSSRDIKSTETEQAKAKNINPVRSAMAYDALVPVTHPSTPVQSLRIEQLRDMYMGKITNWKEVGGEDKRVVVISRDTSSGTYETWEEMVMKKERVAPSALLQASNGAVVQAVSQNPNAIGYIGIGYLTPSVKAIMLGDKTATQESAADKSWPLSRELYLFTNGEPAGEIKAFIDYTLDPEKGQKSVSAAGFVPLK